MDSPGVRSSERDSTLALEGSPLDGCRVVRYFRELDLVGQPNDVGTPIEKAV
jgi:hypothetical protein